METQDSAASYIPPASPTLPPASEKGPLARVGAALQRISFEEWLFLVAFALCSFTTLMVRTTYGSVLGLPRESFAMLGYALSTLLLLGKIVLDHELSWRYALVWALVALAGVSFWVAGQWRFSMLFVFIAAAKGVSLKRVAAVALVVQATILVLTVYLAMAGKLYSFTVWREANGTWVPRSSYGYSHPNMLGQVCLTIALAFAVLRFPRFHVADLAVYAVLFCTAAFLVGARTATIGIVLVVLLAVFAPFIMRTPLRQKRMACAACMLFVAALAFSTFMMVFYNPDLPWMHAIDQALSTRFSLAHRFFEVFPPHVFGRSVMAVKLGEFVQEAPDCLYAYVLLKQGIVPAVVLGALVCAVYVRAAAAGIWNSAVMGLLVFAIVGIMEMYAVNFTLDFFLLACGWVLWGQRDG